MAPRSRLSAAAALLVLAGAFAGGLAGCRPLRPGPLDPSQLAREMRNRGLDPSSVVIPFETTEEMRQMAHRIVPDNTPFEKRLEVLLAGLLEGGQVPIRYEARYTGTAAEVFQNHRANCLAFTSLFVAMAREIGVPVFYLDVEDVEKFEKEGDLVVVSGHVSAGYGAGPEIKILDFSAAPKANYRHVHPITDLTAISLFHSNRGAELLRAGRSQEALDWLRKAVAIDPELGRAWVNYGVALRRTGDVAGAEAAYRKALEVDPEGASAYQNLASLLRSQGKEPEADALLEISSHLGSRNPFVYLSLGDLSLQRGQIEEARRFYRRALRLYHDNAEPYAAMGFASLAAGDKNEAARWLKKAVAIDQENSRVKELLTRLGGGQG